MSYSTDVAAARALAETAHAGQTDRAGKPYIDHPARVAARLDAPEAQVAGWLHDVVEDAAVPLDAIADRFGPDTAAAVDALTRREGEAWRAYIERVQAHPLARLVKISDLIDNSNLSRLPAVTLRDVDRQARYNRALRTLLETEDRHEQDQ